MKQDTAATQFLKVYYKVFITFNNEIKMMYIGKNLTESQHLRNCWRPPT